MKQFKVGLQLYSVRNAMKEDFVGTLKAVKEMGYEYVEFAGYFGRTAEEIKALGADLSKRDVESIRRDCDQMEYIKRLYLMLIGESADADTQERESEEKENGK